MEGQVELKKDLMTLEPEEFYFKHIVKSRNWYFSEYLHIPPEEIVDKMDYFKEIVSIKLGISFHSLQIVGRQRQMCIRDRLLVVQKLDIACLRINYLNLFMMKNPIRLPLILI